MTTYVGIIFMKISQWQQVDLLLDFNLYRINSSLGLLGGVYQCIWMHIYGFLFCDQMVVKNGPQNH